MSNWFVHSIFGIILAFICIIFFPNPDPIVMFGAVIATILGSIIPDIDHPKSKVRSIFRSFLLIIAIIFLYIIVSYYVKIDFNLINQTFSNKLFLILLSFSISLFIAIIFIIILESFIPKHRGSIHRIFSGIIYAVLILGISMFYGFPDPLFISFWGFLGFLSHLLVDNFF